MKVLLVCWIGSQKACRRGRSYRVCSKRWADHPSLNMTKVLSCLQMKDPHLLPFILLNIFAMSTSLSPLPFALQVLPSLQALFAVKEPPQNTMAVLTCCMGSAITQAFGSTTCRLCTTCKRGSEYNASSKIFNGCDTYVVSGMYTSCCSGLCETIDDSEGQGILFVRVAVRPFLLHVLGLIKSSFWFVFTKMWILSVTVNTLVCFMSVVKTHV